MLTRKEQIQVIADSADISNAAAGRIHEALMEAYSDSLVKGDSVAVGDIGRIGIVNKSMRTARVGRNPRTGEEIQIASKPAYRDLGFRESKMMRERLN